MIGFSLCSGIGGLDLAMQFVGVRTIGYCENEKYSQSVLWHRMREGWLDPATIHPDVRALTGSAIGSIDLLYGGIPCQPFSTAGKQRGDEDPRNLWDDTFRLLREIRPGFFFLENVAGFSATRRGGPSYAWKCISDLTSIGYDVRWTHVSAQEVGASHRRKRFFLLAYSTITGERSLDRYRMGIEYTKCKYQKQSESQGNKLVNTSGSRRMGSSNDIREYASERQSDWIIKKNVGDTSEGRSVVGHSPSRSRGSESQYGPASTYDYGAVFHRENQQGRTDRAMAFAPSPGNYELWRDILTEHKHLSPSTTESDFCGVADGISNRIQRYRRYRLKALGNAVVPLQAVIAWYRLTSI